MLERVSSNEHRVPLKVLGCGTKHLRVTPIFFLQLRAPCPRSVQLGCAIAAGVAAVITKTLTSITPTRSANDVKTARPMID